MKAIPPTALRRDGVLKDQHVAWNDRHYHSDRPVSGFVTGSDVLSYWRARLDAESVDLVDVIDLFVACLGQDVLAGGVFGLG
jgi:hypothetical protein